MSLERNILPAPGPRFTLGEDGQVLFTFVIDTASMIGPRLATKRDQMEHAGAYRTFMAAQMDLAVPDAPESPELKPLDLVAEAQAEAEAIDRTFRDDMQGTVYVAADPEHADAVAYAAELNARSGFNGADPAAFDHDGDGSPGGSPRGGNRRKAKAS